MKSSTYNPGCIANDSIGEEVSLACLPTSETNGTHIKCTYICSIIISSTETFGDDLIDQFFTTDT